MTREQTREHEFVPGALREIMARLEGLPSALRQGFTDELWSQIPALVDESAFNPALAIGVPLTVTPQYSTYETITSVVACVPPGATALVQLGSMTLPLWAGVTVMTDVRKMLGTAETRTLILAGAPGPAALWLTGQQTPTFGVMG